MSLCRYNLFSVRSFVSTCIHQRGHPQSPFDKYAVTYEAPQSVLQLSHQISSPITEQNLIDLCTELKLLIGYTRDPSSKLLLKPTCTSCPHLSIQVVVVLRTALLATFLIPQLEYLRGASVHGQLME